MLETAMEFVSSGVSGESQRGFDLSDKRKKQNPKVSFQVIPSVSDVPVENQIQTVRSKAIPKRDKTLESRFPSSIWSSVVGLRGSPRYARNSQLGRTAWIECCNTFCLAPVKLFLFQFLVLL